MTHNSITTCERCERLLSNDDCSRSSNGNNNLLIDKHDETKTTTKNEDNGVLCCHVCLGMWDIKDKLKDAIQSALEPYGGNKQNCFSSEPTINIPGDLAYRFYYEGYHRQQRQRRNNDNDDNNTSLPWQSSSSSSSSSTALLGFVQEIKHTTKSILHDCLKEIEDEETIRNYNNEYPTCVCNEELGYLGIHIIAIPAEGIYRPTQFFTTKKGTKRNRSRNNNNHNNQEYTKQGGDPRINLEKKLNNNNITIWSINQAFEMTDWEKYHTSISELNREDFMITTKKIKNPIINFHVAIWRRPFYIRGMYTKTRRDVSQSPFYVIDDGNKHKLGVTSVEEQITPAIIRACNGISTLNNDPNIDGNIMYGMAKFHASGREDMDVRMLLPDNESLLKHDDANKKITGRPFVFEIYDAVRMPKVSDLDTIIREVNYFTDNNDKPDPRSYGRNPYGVGIAPILEFVPSSSFKKLQEETENKIKHYGCLCWSENILPVSNDEIMKKLGSFPLEIQQKTPIRVLHRRSNIVRTRHVLSCTGIEKIDNHYFRIHISTTAGTYVKEFVHGDLGRTIPSISTLLGCNTDILELDCEGIQM